MAFPTNANVGDLHQPAPPTGPSYIYRGGGRWDLYVDNSATDMSNYYTKAQEDAAHAALAASTAAALAEANAPGWAEVTGKPATFPADAHSHATSEITGLDAALAGKAATGHTHTKADIGLGNVDNTSDTAKPVSTAVQAALDALGATIIPPGAVADFAMATAPAGWLKANGAVLNRTTYAALFSAIGTTFGAGDGSTTFTLPDLRGEFRRGWDDGRGVDSARQFGSAQSEDIGPHTHPAPVAGGFWVNSPGAQLGGSGYDLAGSLSTGASTGTETRPRNIALLACIKY